MSELIRRTHDEAGNEYGKLTPNPTPSPAFCPTCSLGYWSSDPTVTTCPDPFHGRTTPAAEPEYRCIPQDSRTTSAAQPPAAELCPKCHIPFVGNYQNGDRHCGKCNTTYQEFAPAQPPVTPDTRHRSDIVSAEVTDTKNHIRHMSKMGQEAKNPTSDEVSGLSRRTAEAERILTPVSVTRNSTTPDDGEVEAMFRQAGLYREDSAAVDVLIGRVERLIAAAVEAELVAEERLAAVTEFAQGLKDVVLQYPKQAIPGVIDAALQAYREGER